MMDGHSFRLNSPARPRPSPGYTLSALGLYRDRNAPEYGESKIFPGGSITVRARAGYEVYFEADDADLISFSLDSAAEVLTSYNGEALQNRTIFPGHMHYHPAGSTVYARYDGDAMQLVTVAIRSDVRNELLGQIGVTDFVPRSVGNLRSRLAEPLGQRLRHYVQDRSLQAPAIADTLARLALYEALMQVTGKARAVATPPGKADSTPLQRAVEFIEENLHRDVSLGEIADIACKSPFHFARTFKDAMGITPVAYVIAKRIERSKAMLHHTDLPISTIAERCGFNSQSHFCRTFRRLEHQSPRQYRRAR